jgi:hypothetical protein
VSRTADYAETGVDMIEVESADVLAMRDEQFSELLDEINAKQQQLRMSTLLGSSVAFAAMLVVLIGGAEWVLVFALAAAAYGLGKWLDSYRRTTVLFYELEPEVAEQYEELTSAFDRLISCGGKWHIAAGGTVSDLATWKRNAGAARLLDRTDTVLIYSLPGVIKSNITPPALHVGKQVLYLLPDVALVAEGQTFGAINYRDLSVRWQDSYFIEEASVPRDATIVSHTWKHPNKNGGPDRRFKDNYQIPVCEYEAMHLTSSSGLSELLQFSCTGVSRPLASAVERLGRIMRPAAAPRPRLSGP